MSKLKLLERLLGLCTDEHRDMFTLMYPHGVKTNQVDNALTQVERTIRDAVKGNKPPSIQTVEDNIQRLESDALLQNKRIDDCNDQISTLHAELEYANRRIEWLTTPVATDNADIHEKLDKLYKLEVGGVDNWEWYDISMGRTD